MAVDRYAEIHAAHRWDVPARFNIAHACCGRWADDRARFALYWEDESGATRRVHVLGPAARGEPPVERARGARRRRAATGRADPAAAAARPSSRTSPSTRWARSRCRCRSCSAPRRSSTGSPIRGAKVAIVDPQSLPNLAPIRGTLPRARARRRRRRRARGVRSRRLRRRWSSAASPHFAPVDTRADDPALIVYTSGTTGPPKGALMPHRCLLGNLPGFVHSHDGYPQRGRPLLVAGRLGVDRRPHGRAAADALLRPADRRLSRPLRPRARARA